MWKAYLKDLLVQVTIMAIEKLVEVIKKYGDTEAKIKVKSIVGR